MVATKIASLALFAVLFNGLFYGHCMIAPFCSPLNFYNLVKSPLPINLQGIQLESRNGTQFRGYLGIRYGIIPQRFSESQPVPFHKEVGNGTAYGPICAQTILGNPHQFGDEDCLFLNVYTPKADNSTRPVVVYIHGGGFTFHSGNAYGPNYFMDEDTVFVTINYRLGIFGFFSTGDDLSPGNFGLKDQVLALKWVQQNIHAFGGDPSRVTILGESAGSAAIIYQILTPLSKGLFHRAIALSGTPLSPWGFSSDPKEVAVRAAANISCDTSSSASIVNCLKTKTTSELLNAQNSFTEWFMDHLVPFSPVVEYTSPQNPNPFITSPPAELMESGNFSRVPLILTMCREEGLFPVVPVIARSEPLLDQLNLQWNKLAPLLFSFDFDPHAKEIAVEMKEFYLNGQNVSLALEPNFTNAYTDVQFFRGTRETVLRMGKFIKVYLGLLTYESKVRSNTQLLGIPNILGISHADDLKYLFNQVDPNDPLPIIGSLKDEDDTAFSYTYVRQIANFARNGDVSIQFSRTDGVTTPQGSSCIWSPVSQEEINSRQLNFQTLNPIPSVEINYASERARFWDNINNKYGLVY